MLDREDMLELTRRMTPRRHCFTRAAGCYSDEDGLIDGTFNIHFLKLSGSDLSRNILLAKTVPFSETNHQLIEYDFPDETKEGSEIRQMLELLIRCELKNDALLDVFYDLITQTYEAETPYAFYLYNGVYDVPRKGTDHESQWESEEIYRFLIGIIASVDEDYNPEEPQCGFLYPVFSGRSSDYDHIAVFQADPDHPHNELRDSILHCKEA